jgi:acyl-CoA reductase-like NAD-dependent aldehyde dehydrogenase
MVAYPDRLYVGGQWIEPSSREVIEVTDPATEASYLRVPSANVVDIERAVAAARTAFDEGPWPRLTHEERAQYLRRMADALRSRHVALGRMWSREVGVVHAFAQSAITETADIFERYAQMASTFPFEERHRTAADAAAGILVREPVGVVGAIIPWNVAAVITAWKVAPALLAGCTVVLKASPESPSSAYVMGEVADEAGLPAGVLNCVVADRTNSEALVRDPRVDKITFTGSTSVGRRIASICGDRVARVSLELGGKSAALVLDDFDIREAATSISNSTRLVTGQLCGSLTRIIVKSSRHDDLVDALCGSFQAISVGDPFDPTTDMGPLAGARQRARVERYIEIGLAGGARLATGGGRPHNLERGFYVEPTVFARVDNSSTIAREEIFGPVISVIPARDDADAIAIANDSPYGLAAAVFTHDADRALEVARRLRSGTVGHNGAKSDFTIAFGGFKQSGLGREGGSEGLRAFLETKTILLDAEPSLAPVDALMADNA